MKREQPRSPSPDRSSPHGSHRAFITITPEGEICAWGLEKKSEEQILHLTGNPDLVKALQEMACDLCG
ncbi:MAG: hypothetical protein GXO34_06915 [Deltaproteobacteria bacterium]|nr:hypothetical protein [Deltaproteobacteria bacterium]